MAVNKDFTVEYDSPKDMATYFNVHRLPDFNHVPESYMAFIIFTRPDLNIFDPNTRKERSWFQSSSFWHHLATEEGRTFTESLTRLSDNILLPHFTQRAKGFRVDGRALKVNEMGDTYMGQTIGYAGPSYDHRRSRTLDIEFENDRLLSVYRTVSAWRDYIQMITYNTRMRPFDEYIFPYPVLDYAGAMWYIVTKRDARTVVFWQKYYGVFPKSVPDDIFSSGEGPIFEKSLSISFHASGVSEPNDLEALVSLNMATGMTRERASQHIISRYEVGDSGLRITSGRAAMAKTPYLHIEKNNQINGNSFHRVLLEWCESDAPSLPGAAPYGSPGGPGTSITSDKKWENKAVETASKAASEQFGNKADKSSQGGPGTAMANNPAPYSKPYAAPNPAATPIIPRRTQTVEQVSNVHLVEDGARSNLSISKTRRGVFTTSRVTRSGRTISTSTKKSRLNRQKSVIKRHKGGGGDPNVTLSKY